METSERRIPRLMMAVLEGYPLGNIEAAMEELAYVTSEYLEIAEMLEKKLEKINDDFKRKIISNAIFVLRIACQEFDRIRQEVHKSLNPIKTELLLEQIEILKHEFEEINRALIELVKLKWWMW